MSMSLSKVGTGESNHLHWTRTGCEGGLMAALVGVTGEAGARVRSVIEGEEDRELELDREIVSVQRANLEINF